MLWLKKLSISIDFWLFRLKISGNASILSKKFLPFISLLLLKIGNFLNFCIYFLNIFHQHSKSHSNHWNDENWIENTDMEQEIVETIFIFKFKLPFLFTFMDFKWRFKLQVFFNIFSDIFCCFQKLLIIIIRAIFQ